MADLLHLGLTVAFFALCFVWIEAFDALSESEG